LLDVGVQCAQRRRNLRIGEPGQQPAAILAIRYRAAPDRLDQEDLEQPIQHQIAPGAIRECLIADEIEHAGQPRCVRARRPDLDHAGQQPVEQRRIGVVEPEMSANQPRHGSRSVASERPLHYARAWLPPDEVDRDHIAARSQRPHRRRRQQQEVAFAQPARLALRHLEDTASACDQTEYGAPVGRESNRPVAAGFALLPEQPLRPQQRKRLGQGIQSGRSHMKSGQSNIERPDRRS
jgi:hypothetical protein